MDAPEVWLRGAVAGVHPLLQPAAHAFLQIREEIPRLIDGLDFDQLWARPGGAASIGFHLAHVAGSLDRLLTYSRGLSLSPAQFDALNAEESIDRNRPDTAVLLTAFIRSADAALERVRQLSPEELSKPCGVGRRKLPSTAWGLIFHAAEHSARHAGQIATLVRVVNATHRP